MDEGRNERRKTGGMSKEGGKDGRKERRKEGYIKKGRLRRKEGC